MQKIEQTDWKELDFKEFINSFSLLVVFGSISTAYFVSNVYKASLSYSFYWLLGSTVWIIYTIDHLIDSRSTPMKNLSLRHRIHKKYSSILWPLVVALIVFNFLISLLYLPSQVWYAGLSILSLVSIYFWVFVFKRKVKFFLAKEIAVAFGVVAGMIWLPASQGGISYDMEDFLFISTFFSLNLTNLVIFSLFDVHLDNESDFSSVATSVGESKTQLLVYNLLALSFLFFGLWTFLIITPTKWPVTIIFLCMLNILGFLMIKKHEIKDLEFVRFWGDFIYLLPTPLWWMFG